MNILYYLGSFPKLSKSFVLNEIDELEKRGYNISVFALSDDTDKITHSEYDDLNLDIYRVGSLSKKDISEIASPLVIHPRVLKQTLFVGSLKYHIMNLIRAKKCIEFINEIEFDIHHIHVHFASPSRQAAIYVASYYDVPITVTAHAFEIFRSPNVRQVRRICNSMDHVIVPSEYNRVYLREKFGVENEISVVPATTRVSKFKPSCKEVPKRLLTVARLVEKKGYEHAIDAVAALVERGLDVEYHIVGKGKRKQQLQQRVARHGIEDHVTFLGHVSDERLRRELSEASVFVLPCVIAEDGDRDAMPVVLKEAMAAETACVSTTVSAVPELITDGEDGLLVPPREHEPLAEAIEALLHDDDLRKRLAKRGSETVVENFDIGRSIDKMEALFESLSQSASK